MKGDLDVRLPVDRELLPALLVKRCARRKGARAQNQDIGQKFTEYFGRRALVRRIERQNFNAGDLFGQSLEQFLVPRYHKHVRAAADTLFHNPASYAPATADHSHVLAC